MSRILEQFLSDLYASLSMEDLPEDDDLYDLEALEEGQLQPARIVAIIENSMLYGEGDGAVDDQTYCSNLLFDSETPPSLLKYLQDSMSNTDTQVKKAKEAAFKLIAAYIKRIGAAEVLPFAPRIMHVCMSIFEHDAVDSIKKSALLPVKNVLRFRVLAADSLLEPGLGSAMENVLGSLAYPKQTSGKRCEVFKVLGLMVRAFPHHHDTVKRVQPIMQAAYSALATNFDENTTKKSEPAVIEGAFSCLDNCFHAHGHNFNNSLQHVWTWLLYALLAASKNELNRFAMVRKALRIIKNHAGLFREVLGIGDNLSKSFEYVEACYRAENGRDQLDKHVEEAVTCLLREGAWCLAELSTGDSRTRSMVRQIGTIKDNFVQELQRTADSGTGENSNASLAVKGLAALSPAMPALEHAVPGTCASVQNTLVDSSRFFLLSVGDDAREHKYMSTKEARPMHFLQAIASTAGTTSEDGWPAKAKNHTVELAQLCVLDYATQDTKDQQASARALCALFLVLSSHQGMLDDVVGGTVMPALLVRAVSQLQSDEEGQKEYTNSLTGEPDSRLFYPYAALLSEVFIPEDPETKAATGGVGPSGMQRGCYRDRTVPAIFDEWMLQCLRMLKRLDISYSPMEEDTTDGSLLANNDADQEVYINLVSLLELVLPHHLPERFLCHWWTAFFEEALLLLGEHPMVSSSYRLLRCLVDVVVDAGLFTEATGCGLVAAAVVEPPLSVTRSLLALKPALSQLGGVLPTFSGELLSAALAFILHLPVTELRLAQGKMVTLVTLDDMIEPLKMAFETGLYCVAAVRALDALVAQRDITRGGATAEGLSSLLPLLDRHLVPVAEQASDNYSSGSGGYKDGYKKVAPAKRSTKTSKTARERQHISRTNKLGRVTGSGGSSSSSSSSSSSRGSGSASDGSLQHTILQFLGRLGGRNQHILLDVEHALSSSLSWNPNGSKNLLTVDMPLPRAPNKLALSLDALLPRLVELCEQTSDASLRLVAAECLHSVMHVMIGRGASLQRSSSGDETRKSLAALYAKVLPVAIRLAACRQPVVDELFETLLIQMTHWFSGINHVSSYEASALATALSDGLCEPNNSAVRDLCARALAESFSWALKQTSKDELARNPVGVDQILSNLFVLAEHPLENKRVGAAAALNKVYRVLREETSLVHRYAMKTLYTLLLSLRRDGYARTMSAQQGPGERSNSTRECIFAVKHYLHIVRASVVERGDEAGLRESSNKRDFPSSLGQLVKWLWDNVSSEWYEFRMYCMICLDTLYPVLLHEPGGSTAFDGHAQQTAPTLSLAPMDVDEAEADGGVDNDSAARRVCEKLFSGGSNDDNDDFDSGGGADGDEDLVVPSTLLPALASSLEQRILARWREGGQRAVAVVATPPDAAGSASMSVPQGEIRWLRALCGALHAYRWVLKSDIFSCLSVLDIWTKPSEKSSSSSSSSSSGRAVKRVKVAREALATSHLWEQVSAFLDYLAQCGASDTHATRDPADADDTGPLCALRLECLRRLLELVTRVLDQEAKDMSDMRTPMLCTLVEQRVWSHALCSAIYAALLEPRHAGIFSASRPGAALVRALTVDMPASVSRFLPHVPHLIETQEKFPSLNFDFDRGLSNAVSKGFQTVLSPVSSSGADGGGGREDTFTFACFLRTFSLLRDASMLSSAFGHNYVRTLQTKGEQVLASLLDLPARADPAVVHAARPLLRLVWEMGVPIVAPAGVTSILGQVLRVGTDTGPTAIGVESGCARDTAMALFLSRFGPEMSKLLLRRDAAFLCDRSLCDELFALVCSTPCGAASPTSLQPAQRRLLGFVLAEVVAADTLPEEACTTVVTSLMCAMFRINGDSFGKGERQDGHIVLCDLGLVKLALQVDARVEVVGARHRGLLKAATARVCAALTQSADGTTEGEDPLLAALEMLPLLVTVEQPVKWNGGECMGDQGYDAHAQWTTDAAARREQLSTALQSGNGHLSRTFFHESTALDPQSAEGRVYASRLRCCLDSFRTCGAMALPLLGLLRNMLREGRNHRYWAWIDETLWGLGACVPPQLLSDVVLYCLREIAAPAHEKDVAVKLVLLDCVLLRTLEAMDVELVSPLLDVVVGEGDRAKSLAAFLVTRLANKTETLGIDTLQTARDSILLKETSLRMLTALLDALPLHELQTAAQSVLGAHKVHIVVLKAARAVVLDDHFHEKELEKKDKDKALLLRLRAAAYACATLVVAKTQSKEDKYLNFIFKLPWIRFVDANAPRLMDAVRFFGSRTYGACGSGRGGVESAAEVRSRRNLARRRGLSSTQAGGASQSLATQALMMNACPILARSSVCNTQADGSEGTAVARLGVGAAGCAAMTAEDKEDALTQAYMRGASQGDGALAAAAAAAASAAQNEEDNNSANELVRGLDDVAITLEMDPVNRANDVVMSAVVRAVTRMSVQFGADWAAQPDVLPPWLGELLTVLCSTGENTGERSARIFVLRLLLNQPVADIVAPWAQALTSAVLACAVNDLFMPAPAPAVVPVEAGAGAGAEAEVHTTGLHFLLRDLVQRFADTWGAVRPSATTHALMGTFLGKLFGVAFSDESEVNNANVLCLDRLIAKWVTGKVEAEHTHIVRNVDLAPLTRLVSVDATQSGGRHSGDKDYQKRVLGLRLTYSLLRAGYPLVLLSHDDQEDAMREVLLKWVLDSLTFPRKEVARWAGEVSGLVLLSISAVDASASPCVPSCCNESFRNHVGEALLSVKAHKGGADLMCTVLKAVSHCFPSFLFRDLFLKVMAYGLTGLKAEAVSAFLDTLAALPYKNDGAPPFKGISIAAYLRDNVKGGVLALLSDLSTVSSRVRPDTNPNQPSRSTPLPMVQLTTLRTLVRFHSEIDDNLLFSLLGGTSTEGLQLLTAPQTHMAVRELAFDFLLLAFKQLGGLHQRTAENRQLGAAVLLLLMRGLNDPDVEGMVENDDPPAAAAAAPNGSVATATAESAPAPPARRGIRKKLLDFFDHQDELGLSECPFARLSTLIHDFFPSVEDSGVGMAQAQWMHFVPYLLLNISSRTWQWNQPLHRQGLAENISFVPLRPEDGSEVYGAGRRSQKSKLPMFALERTSQRYDHGDDTQHGTAADLSQLPASSYAFTTQAVDAGRGAGFLRATQTLGARAWTQTQTQSQMVSQIAPFAPGMAATRAGAGTGAGAGAGVARSGRRAGRGRYHFHGSGLQTTQVANENFILGATQQQQQQVGGRAAAVHAAHSGATVTATAAIDDSSSSSSSSVFARARPRGRRVQFAPAAVLQDTARARRGAAAAATRQARRKARVVLYRQYRSGDLPDIELLLKDAMAPIQGLCLRDAPAAGVVFSQLFCAMYDDRLHPGPDNSGQPIEVGSSTDVLRRGIASLVQACAKGGAPESAMSASLISCLLHCVRHRSSEDSTEFFNTQHVASLAQSSLNLHGGILLLEEHILSSDAAAAGGGSGSGASAGAVPAPSSTSSTDGAEARRQDWSLLYALYEGLGERDVLPGLCAKISTFEETGQALDCETRGAYELAIRQYDALLSRGDPDRCPPCTT
jgi:hypothetical protein